MKFGRSIVFVTAFASSGVHAGFVCDFGGVIDVNERCDDGNQTSDDGCSNCSIDLDFSCAGAPSVCAPVQFCGNGAVEGTEGCDDANDVDGDGCSACAVEPGFACDNSGAREASATTTSTAARGRRSARVAAAT